MNFVRGYPDEVYALRADSRPHLDDRTAGLDVRAVVNLLWRARYAIALVGLVGFFLAISYVATLAPTYTATAKVLFSPDQRQVVDLKDVIVNPAQDGLQNQIEILRSTHLMGRVVERAKLYDYPLFNPQLRPKMGWRETIAPLVQRALSLPATVFGELGLTSSTPSETEAPGSAAAVANKVQIARRILAGRINLDPVPDSRVIAISATTNDPDLSATVVNAVAQEYITAQLDAKLNATREATTWLSARVAELKQELAEQEAAINTYRSGLAADTGQSVGGLEAELQALNQAIASAATARSAAQVRYQAVRDAVDNPDADSSAHELERSELIQKSRVRARELAIDRAALAALVDPGHERLARLDASLNAVRAEIQAEAERISLILYSDLLTEAARERQLREQAMALQQRLNTQDSAEVELRELEREAQASRIIYETFLSRLKETTQQEKLHEADAMVISPAEASETPDSTWRKRLSAMGSLIGLMSGLALTLILDRLNNTFRALEGIEEMTGLTVLGTIPYVPQAHDYGGVLPYVLDKPSSALAESIRSLRTSMMFSHVDEPPPRW